MPRDAANIARAPVNNVPRDVANIAVNNVPSDDTDTVRAPVINVYPRRNVSNNAPADNVAPQRDAADNVVAPVNNGPQRDAPATPPPLHRGLDGTFKARCSSRCHSSRPLRQSDNDDEPPRQISRLSDLIRENHKVYNRFMTKTVPRILEHYGIDLDDQIQYAFTVHLESMHTCTLDVSIISRKQKKNKPLQNVTLKINFSPVS